MQSLGVTRPRVSTPGGSDVPPAEWILKKSAETLCTIRHRKNRCGRKGSSSSFAAAFGRPFCFFSPEQRPTRPHEAPSDAPPARNANEGASHTQRTAHRREARRTTEGPTENHLCVALINEKQSPTHTTNHHPMPVASAHPQLGHPDTGPGSGCP